MMLGCQSQYIKQCTTHTKGGSSAVKYIHILNPRNDNSVIGCELSLQLRLPDGCASAMVLCIVM